MRRLLVLSALLLGFAGCVTPSIPIPPPDPAKMTFGVTTDAGVINSASLTYPMTDAYRGGVYYVFNRNNGHGIIQIADPDGGVTTTPTPATADDQLVVSIENNDQTVSTCVVLRGEGAPAGQCF